ncbi:polysaccharide deacetylase family protein [Jatrophihabitans sp. DSM 45814]
MSAVNLCFHGIGVPQRDLEPGEGAYWITESVFSDVLDLVADRPQVRISFDDGNASDFEIGLPALLARGLKGSFFPLSQRIDQPGSTTGEHLRDMVDAGMTIGTHGMRHLPWPNMSERELDDELVAARAVISDAAGVAIETAACPLGRYDRRVLGRLRKLGYRRVFTSDRARARSDSWLQPRYSIRENDDAATMRAIFDHEPSGRSRLQSSGRITIKRLR